MWLSNAVEIKSRAKASYSAPTPVNTPLNPAPLSNTSDLSQLFSKMSTQEETSQAANTDTAGNLATLAQNPLLLEALQVSYSFDFVMFYRLRVGCPD
jgi:hypothetical protein